MKVMQGTDGYMFDLAEVNREPTGDEYVPDYEYFERRQQAAQALDDFADMLQGKLKKGGEGWIRS